MVRTQLPTSLLMKVETARHKSSLCVELAGKGQERQLHLTGGDVTYTMTFQLGYVVVDKNCWTQSYETLFSNTTAAAAAAAFSFCLTIQFESDIMGT